MVPGHIAFGHSSALAGAPSMTGGIFSIDSSSLGNWNPASLKALPKSFSLGKSMWHVLQLVPYWRENAGMAKLGYAVRTTRTNRIGGKHLLRRRNGCVLIATLLCMRRGSGRRIGPLPKRGLAYGKRSISVP